jgi:hypothetical protein
MDMTHTEQQIQDELSGYFFHDQPIPAKFWIAPDQPPDLTSASDCQRLIWQVRKAADQDPRAA